MKTLIVNTFKLAIAALFTLGTLAVQVKAQGNVVSGLLMGAGSGALIGQAIGRNTEATLIGTAAGGVLGSMIGNEMDRKAHSMDDGLAQPVAVFHPVRHQVFPHRICRDFIVAERRHGYSREVVVKTECRERHLNHFRGDYRHHFRDDYRHHFRDDPRYHFRDNHQKHFRGDNRHRWKGSNRHHRW